MAELPLFPLNTVLFPGGRCQLRVFEKRYMDMVTAAIKTEQPFGICLISAGREVGEAAEPHAVGTTAHAVECDLIELGILGISVRGGRRFRIGHTHVQPDQLIVADAQYWPHERHTPLPATYQHLSRILQQIIAEIGEQYYFPPVKLDDANWVGYRLAELLPISNRLRQNLLEETDPANRLDMLTAAVQAGHA